MYKFFLQKLPGTENLLATTLDTDTGTYNIMNMFFILIVKRLEASGHWALDKSVFIIVIIIY